MTETVVEWDRNIPLERGTTRLAAKGVADPDPIIEHAETRAHNQSGEYVADPGKVAPKDWLREIRAELADARNYLVWWLTELACTGQGDSPAGVDMQRALRHVIIAYQLLSDLDR